MSAAGCGTRGSPSAGIIPVWPRFSAKSVKRAVAVTALSGRSRPCRIDGGGKRQVKALIVQLTPSLLTSGELVSLAFQRRYSGSQRAVMAQADKSRHRSSGCSSIIEFIAPALRKRAIVRKHEREDMTALGRQRFSRHQAGFGVEARGGQ